MKVELFVLCDAATEWMGKLNILGTFDTIRVQEVPAVHAHCAVAMQLRLNRSERGQHQIRIGVVDADGHLVVPPLEATLRADFPEEADSQAVHLILNIQHLKFDRMGEYAVDLTVDGRQRASLPLFVRSPVP